MATLVTVTKAWPYIAGSRSKRYIDSLRDHRTLIPTFSRIRILPTIPEDAEINHQTPYSPPPLRPFAPKTVRLVVEHVVPKQKRYSVLGKPTVPQRAQGTLVLTPQTTWENVRFHMLTLVFRSFFRDDDHLPNDISLTITLDFEALEMDVTAENWSRARTMLARQGGMLWCRFEVGRGEKNYHLRAAAREVLRFLGFQGDVKSVKATGKRPDEQGSVKCGYYVVEV